MPIDLIAERLIFPLSLALIGLALGLAALMAQRRAWAIALISLAGLGLAVCSMPITAGWLMQRLQAPYPEQPIGSYPAVDVAVVLGGVARPTRHQLDFGPATDRVWYTAALFKAEKIRWILASGGCAACLPGEGRSQARVIRTILEDFGVPRERIRLEEQSRSTRQNALHCAETLARSDADTVLLVTSAYHMRRAAHAFQAVGVRAIPAATDYHGMPDAGSPDAWLPSAKALSRTTIALREYLAYFVYRLRGWVAP